MGIKVLLQRARDMETRLRAAEREIIESELRLSCGCVVAAAEWLRMSRTTLYRRMGALGIEPASFAPAPNPRDDDDDDDDDDEDRDGRDD